MKSIKTKIMAFLLSLAMVLTAFPLAGLSFSALAAEDVVNEGSDLPDAVNFQYESPQPAPVDPEDVDKDLMNVYQETRAKVASSMETKEQAVYGKEWLALDLARDGLNVTGYYEQDLVATIINNNGVLHTNTGNYTNYAKATLVLTALGMDAAKIGGYDLTQKLMDFEAVSAQGINGIVFALLALDSAEYPITSNNGVTRDTFINAILGGQLSDGGWDFAGKAADPDMTALALQALAPYYTTNSSVQESVNRALETLSKLQTANGGFQTEDAAYAESSESTSMVILALLALNIDPAKDPRFIKNGKTTLDNLCSFAVEGGGFKHIATGGYNALATDQGYRALTGYFRFLENLTSVYNMTDSQLFPVAGELSTVIVTEPLDPEYRESDVQKILSADEVKKIGGKIDALYEVCLVATDGVTLFNTIPAASESQMVEVTVPADQLVKVGSTVLVAGVHNGQVLIITPTSFDRKTGTVIFPANLFSAYAVVSGSAVSPKTGESSSAGLWIVLLAAMAIGGATVLFIKRRSARR